MPRVRFHAQKIPGISFYEQGFKPFTATEPPIGSIIVYKISHVYDEFEPSYSVGRVVSRQIDDHVFGVKLHHTIAIDYNGKTTSMLFFNECTMLFSETSDDLICEWSPLDVLKACKTTPRATIDYRALNRLLLSIPPSQGIPLKFHVAIKNYFDGDHYNHNNEVSGLFETHEQAGRAGSLFGEIPLSVIDLVARILSGHPFGHLTKIGLDGRESRRTLRERRS